ncbi:GFA family protein [Kaustia mangrovi]|uniref:GFA family protein n=1 Tax=Kaustia mangrovi TaxID=2593653 RepID=A0A7S8HB78_9HYPH|nr:GFA family protein [Kaustia mangrovi]QPC42315.1 GFA family protein [Kaustia mangrovi]
MTAAHMPLAGACRCGRIGLEISAPPVMTSACHCRGCQRMSASAFSLSAMVPAQAFRVMGGEPVKGGAMSPQIDHYFCPDCKTWMFTEIAGLDGLVNVRSTMLDDPAWSRPFIETMTAEKLAWARTPARHSYEGFPPPEDFGRLLEEFAAER